MSLLQKISSSGKRIGRTAGLLGIMAASSALQTGCGGSKSSPTSDQTPTNLTQAEIALTSRLAEAQLQNGSWAFQQLYTSPIDYFSLGLPSTAGLTALGLFDTHKIDMKDNDDTDTWFVPGVLERTKNYLNTVMNDYNNNVTPSVSLPNFEFMNRYDAHSGLNDSEKIIVQSAWDKLLDNANTGANDTDPTVRVDGIYNEIANARTTQGIPGAIGWDNSFVLRSALSMNEPQTEIDWLRQNLKNLPVDTTATFGLESAAHTLYALNKAGDSSINQLLLEAIMAQSNFDGSFSGPLPESRYQANAYILMGLKSVNSPDASLTQGWLESRIDIPTGQVYDPATNLETFPASGEVLFSLTYYK